MSWSLTRSGILLFTVASSQLLQGCSVNFSNDVSKRLKNAATTATTITAGPLTVSSTFDFGYVSVGSSGPLTVNITNTGPTNYSLLNFGYLPAEVTRDNTVTNDCGVVLSAGASCSFKVLYTPTAATVLTANFLANYDPGNGSYTTLFHALAGQAYQLSLTYPAISPQVGIVGTALNITPQALTVAGISLTSCTVFGGTLPAGLSLDGTTCVISGTPTAVSSATSYTIRLTNYVSLTSDTTLSIRIDAGAPMLSYSGATGTAGTVGAAMSIAPTTLSANGAAITACGIKGGSSPSSLPAGLSVNPTTCVISGTPSAVASNATYTLVATNSVGTSADSTVSLSVAAGLPVLSYAGATGTAGAVGTAMSVSPTVLTTNGGAITACGIKGGSTPSSLPAGLSVNATTCVISGTPTATATSSTYTLVATNSSGTSADATVTLSVAGSAPILSYSGATGTTGTFGSAMSVSPTTLTPNGASITACGIKGGSSPSALPSGLSVDATTCVISGTPSAAAASATYTLVATNSAGTSADATVTLTVNAVAPTLSYVGSTGTTGSLGTAMSVAPTILATNGAAVTACGIKGGSTPAALPAGLSVNATTCVISGTPTAAAATATYTLVATNSAGTSADATVSLTVNAGLPVLSYSGATGTSGTFGTAMSITPTTLTPNGAAITACAIKSGSTPSALPAGLSINATTCVISGTPSVSDPGTVYTLVATNSAGNSADAPVTLTIGAAVPVLSYAGLSLANRTGHVGTLFSVTPTTLSPRGAAITACGIKPATTALPATLTVNATTCVISGTPTATLTTTTFTFIATNSVGVSTAATVALVISAGAPVLSYATSTGTSVTFGSAMSVTPSTLTTNGGAISACAIKSGTTPTLPAGLSISATTCVISGTATAPSYATYTLVATNAGGTSADATVTLAVVSVPVLSYAGATGTVAGTGLATTITPTTFSTWGAAITSCGIKGGSTPAALPLGLSVDAATCVISGTPSVATASATYTLVATNSVGTSADATIVLSVVDPTSLSFTPTSGPIGTLVTITGADFSTVQYAEIGAAALIANQSATSMGLFIAGGDSTDRIHLRTATGSMVSTGTFTVTTAGAPATQLGTKLVPSDVTGTTGVYIGRSMAISADGKTAIVGGSGDNGSTGATWVYTKVGSAWVQDGSKLVGSGGTAPSQQGYTVALSADGNTAMIGGYQDNNWNGAVWVFVRSAGVWTQQGSLLVPSDMIGAGRFGVSVSLSADGNTALIGGFFDNSGVGASWIYTRSGGVWTQGPKLIGSGQVGGAAMGLFGAISADGTTAVMGGRSDNSFTGCAWVFAKIGGVWTQQGSKFVGAGTVSGDMYGNSVAITGDGNMVAISAPGASSYNGVVYIYTRAAGVWTQQAKLNPNNVIGSSGLGQVGLAISTDGKTLAAGGAMDNNYVGAVWVFTRSGTTWATPTKLVPNDTNGQSDAGQYLGMSPDGQTLFLGGNGDNNGLGTFWIFTP